MTRTNKSKLKAFLTRIFKKIEQGKPIAISFQDNKTYIRYNRFIKRKTWRISLTTIWKGNIIHKR